MISSRLLALPFDQYLTWFTDLNLLSYRRRLESFKGKYRGRRCFIMGNGPSVNFTPLDMLDGEYVWGHNRCNLLFKRISWRPSFYVAVDARVVPDNADEINSMIESLPATFFFFPMIYRLNKILKSAPNTYWYKEVTISDDNLPEGHFSLDVSRYVRSVRTVTIASLQLAVYLGFNPIYLIGCDTDYKVPDEVHYEDDQKEFIVSLGDSDVDHFAPNYFGTGKKFHQPHPERMFFSYLQVKKLCDQINVQVYNATVGGKLEVFPRMIFETLFN